MPPARVGQHIFKVKSGSLKHENLYDTYVFSANSVSGSYGGVFVCGGGGGGLVGLILSRVIPKTYLNWYLLLYCFVFSIRNFRRKTKTGHTGVSIMCLLVVLRQFV